MTFCICGPQRMNPTCFSSGFYKQVKQVFTYSVKSLSFTYFMDPLLSVLIGTIFGTDIHGSFIMKCKDFGDPRCHHEANIGGYV